MATEHCMLSGYLEHAVSRAEFDKLEDGTFVGRVPSCTGVIAFGESLADCQRKLRSALEDWRFLGIKLCHTLPVIDGIDLNRELVREPLDTL